MEASVVRTVKCNLFKHAICATGKPKTCSVSPVLTSTVTAPYPQFLIVSFLFILLSAYTTPGRELNHKNVKCSTLWRVLSGYTCKFKYIFFHASYTPC